MVGGLDEFDLSAFVNRINGLLKPVMILKKFVFKDNL